MVFEVITNSMLLTVLLGSAVAHAQDATGPKGMYCGGNELVQYSEPIRAARLAGTVFDQVGGKIPHARVQVQVQGSESLLVDITADEKGRFRLPTLRKATYWLGISSPGFKLHVWTLRIVSLGGTKKLNPKLSVGT
jgi:hypothetical protein